MKFKSDLSTQVPDCPGREEAAFASESAAIASMKHFDDDVMAIADLLPSARYVVNLCIDRYCFAVGFIAALKRRQITLLPPNEAPSTLAEIVQAYPDSYILYDFDAPHGVKIPILRFPNPIVPIRELEPCDLFNDQIAAVLFTSGTTGRPVAYPRSWGALVASSRAASRALKIENTAKAFVLGTVPHQHSYGLESIIMLALQHRLSLTRRRLLLPADIIAALAELPQPRWLVTTPIHLRSLMALTGDLPRVERIICATAPLDLDLATAAERKFAAPLYEIYGCTEVGQIAVRRPTLDNAWTCLDGIALERVGADVWVSGPAAANPVVLSDVIELESATRFTLQGRKSDLVNIAGKRSSLAFLNHQLTAIAGVEDGIFVMPDKFGRVGRLSAYVVAPTLSAPLILAALRQRVDPAFLPRPLYLVDALPRNPLGKVTRQAVNDICLETVHS